MPIFNSTNFERQGITDEDQHLTSSEQLHESIIEHSATILRSIKIFTPDLERNVYDNDMFKQNLLNFARGNRHASIQILVSDSAAAVKQGHRLIRLSQQLTSAIKIKKTPEEYQVPDVSFILFDQSAFIYNTQLKKQAAIYSTCKFRSNTLQELFTSIWELAPLDPLTQRLCI